MSVSDDGVVGTVSIGSNDGTAVEEARRRIELILDPPTAELGAEYTGKVVNVTKFGAFVNILPGPRRPAPHLEARSRQAHRPGRGRPQPRRRGHRPRRRHRQLRQALALPRGRGSEPPTRRRSNGGERSESRAPRERVRRGAMSPSLPSRRATAEATARAATSRPHRSTTRGTHRSATEFGDLGPAEVGRSGGGDRGERRGGVAAAAAASSPLARCQDRPVTRR